jgi:hypothetical protein
MSDPTHEERNAHILRRTLCAICWIYAFWSGLFALLSWGRDRETQGAYNAQTILIHAALLVLAGTLLWKPRPGALAAVLVACAGSLFFVALDLQRRQFETALLDGIFIPIALLLVFKSRRPA